MNNLKSKISIRMDHLQSLMEYNSHLERPEYVLDVINSVNKFWSVLSEEDRDYIHGARYAIEENHEWNV